MRKKTLLAFDDLERALDLRAKLLGRQQLATVGNDDKRHASAGEAIGKCEMRGNVVVDVRRAAHRFKLKNGY